MGAIPGRENTGRANSRIIADIRRQAEMYQGQSDFFEWYWPKTGSLNNAQQYWARYQSERHQHELQHPDQPPLTWREYFGAESADDQQQGAAQQGAAQQRTPEPPRRPPHIPANAVWNGTMYAIPQGAPSR